jgi:hypothetical protein
MKGEKTLASGNVFRWRFVQAVGRAGFEGHALREPSPEDLAEIGALAVSLLPENFEFDGVVMGAGQEGMRRAKIAFDQHLGRSSN